MTATTQIVPFCTEASGSGGNRLAPTDYEALTTLLATGFQSGVASSQQINTVLAQSSFMAAGFANWMVSQGISVPDDGNLTNLVSEINSALTAFIGGVSTGFSTGDVKLTLKTTADTGWVMCNDGTIGSASSGATARANADTATLYALLWNNVSNTYAPVTGGRGGSASADFAANKPLALTKVLGRALAIAGSGSGLTTRALGSTFGEETHTLTTTEMPSHGHELLDSPISSSSGVTNLPEADGLVGGGSTNDGYKTNATPSGLPFVQATGGGAAHNNMQPTSFLNAMIKL